MKNYETKLSNWDVKNVGDTAFEDGEKIGIRKVAKALKSKNLPLDLIMETTGLSEAEIEKL